MPCRQKNQSCISIFLSIAHELKVLVGCLGHVVVDAAERDHLEGARAHLERLLRAVAGGVLGVDPEEEVEVDRRGELGRAREPAHLRIVTEGDTSYTCYKPQDNLLRFKSSGTTFTYLIHFRMNKDAVMFCFLY